jgi:cell division protein FtsB
MLKNLKNNYLLLISTFLILYFFFNLMSGNRGLISYFEKKDILQTLQNNEKKLSKNIEELDFKNSLLSDNLDLDYIETLIRERFLFGKKNEQIYIIKDNDTKN